MLTKFHLAAALVLGSHAMPPNAGAEAPTLAAITQAWKQAQEKVRAGSFQWETEQWLAKGSRTPPFSDATIPEKDTTLTRKKTFIFSNARVRYENAGPAWDVRKQQYVERKQIVTWDGETATRYNGDATAPNAFLYDVNVALATESDVRPIQYAVRMFQPQWYTFDENKFAVSDAPVSVDGLECWNIEYTPEVLQQKVAKGWKPLTPVYTVCPDLNYAVVRYAATNKATGHPTLTMEIGHTLDGEFSVWIPSKWTITYYGSAGPFERVTSTVRDYALNGQVPEDVFSMDLPRGTIVTDTRSRPDPE